MEHNLKVAQERASLFATSWKAEATVSTGWRWNQLLLSAILCLLWKIMIWWFWFVVETVHPLCQQLSLHWIFWDVEQPSKQNWDESTRTKLLEIHFRLHLSRSSDNSGHQSSKNLIHSDVMAMDMSTQTSMKLHRTSGIGTVDSGFSCTSITESECEWFVLSYKTEDKALLDKFPK